MKRGPDETDPWPVQSVTEVAGDFHSATAAGQGKCGHDVSSGGGSRSSPVPYFRPETARPFAG